MYTNWNLPDNEHRLRLAVAKNNSIAGVLRELGLKSAGGNVATMRHHISRLDLDVTHHVGQAWNKGNYSEPNQQRHKSTIKQALIRQYGHKCWQCGLIEWQGQPIPLEMDHVDGVNSNNELTNLRILCANCHSLTPTFRNRKRV